MKTHIIEFQVEMEDTNSEGVVFYPNYFRWFDRGTNAFLKSVGLNHSQLLNQYHYAHPVIDCGCQFIHTLRYDDPVRIETTLDEFQERVFRLNHVIYSGDLLVASGYEVRTWVKLDQPEENHRFIAASIPRELSDKLKS